MDIKIYGLNEHEETHLNVLRVEEESLDPTSIRIVFRGDKPTIEKKKIECLAIVMH